MKATLAGRSPRAVAALWLLLTRAMFVLAAPRVDLPGLYYDEAFMAQQARDFFDPERIVEHAESTRAIRIFGRPLPLRNAIYLGSLKSLLLLPSFALLEPTPRVLRLTTLWWSSLALLLLMLWVDRVLGTPTAFLSGTLIALDPTYHFYSLYEWGPFTTGFLCRSAGLLLLTAGWQRDGKSGLAAVGAGGLFLGLGVFNRADFVVVLAALALALLLALPAVVQRALYGKRRLVTAAAVGLAIGAAPMWLTLPELFQTSVSWALHSRGGLDEKLRVLWSVLDGSRFYRVIDAGGIFGRMFDTRAPRSGFGLATCLGTLATAGALGGRVRRKLAGPAHRFVFLAALGTLLATLFVPGAVRAHHLLNCFPFFHVLVASCLVIGWRALRSASRGKGLARAAIAAGIALLLMGNALVIQKTYSLIEQTGGRGWWSDALSQFAGEIDGDPEVRVVSLDWGFHEQLLFLTHEPRMLQPIWRIPARVRERGAWIHRGRPGDVYLVHPERYELFGYGPRFLRAVESLAARASGAVELRRHLDRSGEVVFLSVRFDRPHRVSFRGGAFQIALQ